MKTTVVRLSDGRALAFDETGPPDGTPVFFFHSLFGCRLMPQAAVDSAEKYGLRVINIDRPGIGLSDFQPGRTILDWADDAAELADRLEIPHYRALAVSAGTPYLLAACLRTPERIPRAAIASGITPIDEAGVIHRIIPGPIDAVVKRSLLASTLVHKFLIAGMRRDPERAMKALNSTLPPSDLVVMERPDVGPFVIEGAIEAAKRGLKGWAYDDRILNEPWGFELSDLPESLPIDLWWGADDMSVPVAHAEQMAARMPNAELHVRPGGGHFGGIFDHLDEMFEALLEDADEPADEPDAQPVAGS